MGSRCCGGAASPRGRGSYKVEVQTALRPVGAPPSARWGLQIKRRPRRDGTVAPQDLNPRSESLPAWVRSSPDRTLCRPGGRPAP
jgi:hypothetical protein